MKIKLLLADDQALFREGLHMLLAAQPDFEVVGEAGNGEEALALAAALQPDVVLMDVRMPVLDGVEATRRLLTTQPDCRVIVLTTFDGDEDIYRSLQAGARGYLLKGMTAEQLVGAIRAVHSGKSIIPPAIAEKLAERMNSQELTTRELNVLERIVAGRANKQIASDLFISEATVKTHVNSLLGKLGVTDRTQAATVAIQRGLVHLK